MPNLNMPTLNMPNFNMPNLNMPAIPVNIPLPNLPIHSTAWDFTFDMRNIFNGSDDHGDSPFSMGKPNCEMPLKTRQSFILALAKALIFYGSPSHQSLTWLDAMAKELKCPASFIVLPGLTMISFGAASDRSKRLHLVKSSTRNSLTCLDTLHKYCEQVLSGATNPEEGKRLIDGLVKEKPRYGRLLRILIASVCSTVICSTAYSGSPIDMLLAGGLGGLLHALQLTMSRHHTVIYGHVLELTCAIAVAFFAKAISTIPLSLPGSTIFCYSAISSATITSLLPGFVILTAALEIGWTSAMVPGVLRMVYAFMFTTLLGFGLTLGSSWWTSIWSLANHDDEIVQTMTTTQTVHGSFNAYNTTGFLTNGVTLTLNNVTSSDHFIGGCYRPVDSPRYLMPLPWWSLFLLVPVYTTFSSLKNLQAYNSWKLATMVVLACIAYAANKVAHIYVADTDATVAAFVGAVIMGLAGNAWCWVQGLRKKSTRSGALTLMATGIDFLVPSGLGQSGIFLLADSSSSQYLAAIDLVLGIIKIAGGVTLGLFASNFLALGFTWFLAFIFRKKGLRMLNPAL